MALTAAEEALVRELIAQNPELLSLAGNEATIISKLGATKKNLSQLAAALSLNDTDLLFTRQGTSDKSVALSVLKAFVVAGVPAASETVSGIAEIATTAEATTGTDDLRIMTPLKVAQSIAANTSSASVQGAFSNLKLSATGTNASVAITADAIIVRDSASGKYKTLRNVSETLNTAGSGANGLDTGTLAASTWHYVHVIAKEDGTTDSLLSLSATAPTLPATYLYSARVGAIRTDGTANKYPLSFIQYGRRVRYKVAAGSNVTGLPLMASGALGNVSTPTWSAVGVTSFVPTTAAAITVFLENNAVSVAAIVAPNNSYGGAGSTTNPPPITLNSSTNGGTFFSPSELLLESTNIYYASNSAANYLFCYGWEDNL